MTTAEKLESLTDRSRFELLATSVLRKAEPKYASIIHTGINAKGETIVSPVDGLHRIPYSNPPHYVLVHHTTTDRKRLRAKWLSRKKGDLIKAAALAKKVRHKYSRAVFTLVLTTNQRVESDLIIDVDLQAQAEQMFVDIWELSHLADFLDSTVDGHWLRKLYLGIEAERLSVDLLHQLGRKSLDLYRQEVLLPGQGPLVHRSLIDDILANALPGGPGLCFQRLVGIWQERRGRPGPPATALFRVVGTVASRPLPPGCHQPRVGTRCLASITPSLAPARRGEGCDGTPGRGGPAPTLRR
jgi:hypothetical protein